jgi:hypothetical protein
MRAIDKIFALKALADQPALHIDHGYDDGVDASGPDGLFQFIEGKIASHNRRPFKAPRDIHQ